MCNALLGAVTPAQQTPLIQLKPGLQRPPTHGPLDTAPFGQSKTEPNVHRPAENGNQWENAKELAKAVLKRERHLDGRE